jgi:di/tricarboxylate transporter
MAIVLMVLTLILMVVGKTPLYLTAIIGSALAALAAGFPISGKSEVSLAKLINGSLNPVIADMAGVLFFIGIMEKSGFLKSIIKTVMTASMKVGKGPGIVAAGSLVAGIIGALTGFTQPAVTAVVTGPAAVKLGVNPNKAAGLAAHAGHFGNFAGFTHPTQVAVVATAAIGFGWINVVGAITGISIILFSYFRLQYEMKKEGIQVSQAVVDQLVNEMETGTSVPFGRAIFPFLVFCAGFILGYPIFLIGVLCAVLTAVLGRVNARKAEAFMLGGVEKIAIPLIATIGFLFMSSVMNHIGFISLLSDHLGPMVSVHPILTLLIVSGIAGFFTQSNAASVAVDVPFLQMSLAAGADPLTAACAAAGGSAVTQYFLTGGPVAALSTVIPFVPGSTLQKANQFQRPAMIFGFVVLSVIIALMSVF